MFDDKAVGVVIGTGRILKLAVSHQRTFRHVTLTDNHLAGIRPGPVGVAGKVADHAVHPYHLVDVAGKPGRSAPLREPSPLRTVHESFPSYGSSNSKFLL